MGVAGPAHPQAVARSTLGIGLNGSVAFPLADYRQHVGKAFGFGSALLVRPRSPRGVGLRADFSGWSELSLPFGLARVGITPQAGLSRFQTDVRMQEFVLFVIPADARQLGSRATTKAWAGGGAHAALHVAQWLASGPTSHLDGEAAARATPASQRRRMSFEQTGRPSPVSLVLFVRVLCDRRRHGRTAFPAPHGSIVRVDHGAGVVESALH